MALTWRSILMIGVSTLGLVSCTQDKEAEKERPKDVWRLTAPVIQIGGEVVVENAAQSSKLTQLPASAELIFPSLENGHAEGVRIDLTSTCSMGAKTETQSISVKERSRFPFKSLIPIRLLAGLNPQQPNEILCAIKGTATNSIGSVNSFTLNNLKVSSHDLVKGIEAFATSANPPALPKQLQSARQVFAHLICDHFENHRSLGGMAWADLVRDLIQGPPVKTMALESPIAFFGKESEPDPRLLWIRQSCQLVLEAIDSTSGLPDRWVSPPSVVRFPSPNIEIDGSYTISDMLPHKVIGHPAFSARITNHHPIPLKFSLPLDQSASFNMQFLFRPTKLHYYEALQSHPVEFDIAGASQISRENGEVLFTVGAMSTATITARLAGQSRCTFLNEGAQHDTAYVVGLSFGFKRAFPLTLHLNTSSGEPENVVIPWPFTWPGGAPQALEGWMANQDWVRINGTTGRPEVSPGIQVLCDR